jgi:hypothetical protein
VYTSFAPLGVRAHKRITDDVKVLFHQLFQRIGGTLTDPGRVVDLIYTVSSSAVGPRWRPVDTPSKCSFSGEPADVQFQVDVDVYKKYAQWSRATRVTSTLPHVPYSKWLDLDDAKTAPRYFEFFAQQSKIPIALALLQCAAFVSFSNEMYLSHTAADLFQNYELLKQFITRIV